MTTTPGAFLRTAAAALACAGSALLCGCGWTPRDEYMLNQSAAISARSGDGSLLSSEWKAQRGRHVRPAEVAARFESPN